MDLKTFLAEVESGKSMDEVVRAYRDQRAATQEALAKLATVEQERDQLKEKVRNLEGLLQAAQRHAVKLAERVKELEKIVSSSN